MIVLIVVIVLFFIVAMWLATFVVRGGKRQSVTEALEWQSKKYDTSFYNTLSKTDYTVSGYKGYILHVQFLKNPTPTNRYVIISHGYSDNRIGSLKYVQMYMELGFNCIIYDCLLVMHALVLWLSEGVITTETYVVQNVNSVAVRTFYLADVPTSQ